MRTLTEKQQKRRQRSLEWQARWLWPMTFFYLFAIALQIAVVLDKRSQWPLLFEYPPSVGIPLHHSVWVSIFNVAIFSLIIVQLWIRIHNYRRDLFLAEQLALQKTAPPPDGVWPPPPVS